MAENPMNFVYQDVWLNGMCIRKGTRDCASRYEAMCEIFDTLPSGFTMLDIGANEGYFDFRAAEDYGARCLLLERYAMVLEERARLSGRDITVQEGWVNGSDLAEMAKTKHFDVVLALSVIHHLRGEWQIGTDAIFELGDHVFIETANEFESGVRGKNIKSDIWEYLHEKRPRLLIETVGCDKGYKRPLWYFRR